MSEIEALMQATCARLIAPDPDMVTVIRSRQDDSWYVRLDLPAETRFWFTPSESCVAYVQEYAQFWLENWRGLVAVREDVT